MEIYFNELSLMPQSNDNSKARNKVLNLLETMKELKSFDFNIIRTHNNFYNEELCDVYTFSNFINDPLVKTDIKLLLLSIAKNPFIVDEDSYEAETFILDSFMTTDHLDVSVKPEGLAVAYIYNSPTISLIGHQKWENESLLLNITSNSNNQNTTKSIVNLSTIPIINNVSFISWINSITDDIQFNSKRNIVSFFTPNLFEFESQAIEDIISWYYNDKRFILRIKELINDINENPFSGGKGHTELLLHGDGKASKRIIKKDRIVYTYTRDKIIIHQCRGHYDD